MNILVINGPNINMLGIREPDIYGSKNYEDLVSLITDTCDKNDISVEIFHSNHEGAIIDRIQDAYARYDGIIINPGGYTHTSVSILDALRAVNIPTVEVHISDINDRESFRKFSYISTYAIKTISGWGISGYVYAVMFLKSHISKK